VTVTLGDVTIGQPARATVTELHIATDFRALLSRRIEHATLRLAGARIELPLPPLALTSSPSPSGASSVVEIVSIDEIVLSGVEVVSGARILSGDIEVVPQGQGLLIRKIALAAEGTSVNATGQLTELDGPVGELIVTAGALDLDRLVAFVNDFTAGSTGSQSSSAATTPAGTPSRMNLGLTLEAERATMGALTLDRLTGKARIIASGLSIDPVAFDVLGGRYQGSLSLALDRGAMRFSGASTLSNIDMAAVTAFAGNPDIITGRMSGRMDVEGSGADLATVMRTVRGKARIDIADGIIKNLGLLNSVVVATSMRAGSLERAASTVGSQSTDEPFSTLGATLMMADGSITTDDLRLESKDLSLLAAGIVRLMASTVDLKGRVQLSDELTQQAGRDLVRYTQDQGRVTLPATITGPIGAPIVRIDAADMAKRALMNAADEQKERAKKEINEAVKKRLGGLFGR
jgi:AsmA protein